jgi:Ser-tRNA(Ala) deacylase AlaX
MVEMRARMESAQHILYRILTKDYNAIQTGMQIHENKIRIDMRCETDLTSIPKEDFELKVNKIIKMNLPVIKNLYLREKVPSNIDVSHIPSHVKNIVIVAIGDFDVQPCGNEHVNNTSEIGEYHILDIKRKGRDVYRFEGTVT